MATRHVSSTDRASTPRQTSPLRIVLERFAAIAGGIALFLGLFILLAGDDHTITIWDRSWQTGEISEWWGISLAVIGSALIVAFAASFIARRR